MEITWHGQSCFTLKNGKTTIVTDPYQDIGLKLPKLNADIVTISHDHDDHNNPKAVEGDPKVLDWPGEFEVGGVAITGLEAFHYSKSEDDKAKNLGKIIIYTFNVNGIHICHLGDLGHKLTNEINESLGDVDVLMIPVGGKDTINHEKALSVIEQLDPRIVIPMHYKIPDLKVELDSLDPFLKEVGLSNPEKLPKLKFLKKDLPADDKTEYKILEAVTG